MEKIGVEKEITRSNENINVKEKVATITCQHPHAKLKITNDGKTEFCTACNKYTKLEN